MIKFYVWYSNNLKATWRLCLNEVRKFTTPRTNSRSFIVCSAQRTLTRWKITLQPWIKIRIQGLYVINYCKVKLRIERLNSSSEKQTLFGIYHTMRRPYLVENYVSAPVKRRSDQRWTSVRDCKFSLSLFLLLQNDWLIYQLDRFCVSKTNPSLKFRLFDR